MVLDWGRYSAPRYGWMAVMKGLKFSDWIIIILIVGAVTFIVMHGAFPAGSALPVK